MERFVEVGLILGLLWIWSRYYQRACRAVSASLRRTREVAEAERGAPEVPEYPAAVPKVRETVEV